MAVLGQGVVLMVAGMGIAFLFLAALVWVTAFCIKPLARLNGIFPEAAPKKAPAARAGSDDADIALAIAVALG